MSEPNSFWKRFFEDLRRRRVVRVAIGYAIVAWAIVEVFEVILPTFDAPAWVFRAVVAFAFLGFPVTVILAWVFDISSQGVVVTEMNGVRIPPWVKGVVALPLLGVMGWWVWSGYVEERESSVRPTELGEQVPIVAVTLIRNVTGNPDLDWFSVGLANLIRRRYYSLKPEALADVDRWLAPCRLFWSARMYDLKRTAESLSATAIKTEVQDGSS